jgi:hypothetical protein
VGVSPRNDDLASPKPRKGDASCGAGSPLPPGPSPEIRHPRRPFPQLVPLLAAGLLLALDPTFLIGFQQTWWPGPAAIAFYGLFFAAGWKKGEHLRPAPHRSSSTGVIHLASAPRTEDSGPSSHRSATRSFPSHSTSHGGRPRLLLAAGLFPLLLPQIHRHVETPFTGLNLLALTTAYAACSWLAATGLFSIAASIKTKSIPAPVAFIAEASFWMYLVHHPLVGLTQLSLLNTSAPPALKFALSLSIGASLSLASYAVLVRNTALGRLLNGHAFTTPARKPPAPASTSTEPTRRAA